LSRTVREKKVYLRPVKKIELSESHVKLRTFAVVAMIVIAATAFGFGIHSLVEGDKGWINVECVMTEPNCSGDFNFSYHTNGRQTTTAVEAQYSKACVDAYAMFSAKERSADFNNLWKINNEPNTVIELPTPLYEALVTMSDKGKLAYLYLGPIYEEYEALCLADSETDALEFDPARNPDEKEYIDRILGFINSGSDIELAFIGYQKVMLIVSEEYEAFAKEYGKFTYIDFGWMKNAFVIDYIAEQMINAGYTDGCISSFDGFSRCLDDGNTQYSYNVYSLGEKGPEIYKVINYKGRENIVSYRTFELYDLDQIHYRTYADGTRVHPYISPETGLPAATLDMNCLHTKQMSCSELMLETMEYFMLGKPYKGLADKDIKGYKK
jgi:hypothetical protein